MFRVDDSYFGGSPERHGPPAGHPAACFNLAPPGLVRVEAEARAEELPHGSPDGPPAVECGCEHCRAHRLCDIRCLNLQPENRKGSPAIDPAGKHVTGLQCFLAARDLTRNRQGMVLWKEELTPHPADQIPAGIQIRPGQCLHRRACRILYIIDDVE